jgi:hypothetical protein
MLKPPYWFMEETEAFRADREKAWLQGRSRSVGVMRRERIVGWKEGGEGVR